MAQQTTLIPTATPGRTYGSFSGKVEAAPEAFQEGITSAFTFQEVLFAADTFEELDFVDSLFQEDEYSDAEFNQDMKTLRMRKGELRYLNANFSHHLGSADLTGTPTITVSTGGPTLTLKTVSGKEAQVYANASSTNPGKYLMTFTVVDDQSTGATYILKGHLAIEL